MNAAGLLARDVPLSFAQERLWFLDTLHPGSPAYTLAVRRRFHGVLDVAALAKALTEIVRRHEALRTTFVRCAGPPVQQVGAPRPVPLPVVELAQYAVAERHRQAAHVVREAVSRPFDLAQGPLMRAVLLRLASDEHELLVSVHHIVADGWSLGVFSRELTVLYEAFAGGHASPLPEVSLQYADFAVWQRRWLTGEVLERQRRYWLEHLAGWSEPLQLPSDHPRPGRPTMAGSSYDFFVPSPLAVRLR